MIIISLSITSNRRVLCLSLIQLRDFNKVNSIFYIVSFKTLQNWLTLHDELGSNTDISTDYFLKFPYKIRVSINDSYLGNRNIFTIHSSFCYLSMQNKNHSPLLSNIIIETKNYYWSSSSIWFGPMEWHSFANKYYLEQRIE